MVDAAVGAVAVILWGAAAYESLRVHRRPEDRALRALRLTFVFLAAAATLFTPGVQLSISRLLGVPSITEPAARTAVLAAAWSAQALLLHLTRSAPAARSASRRRGVVLLVAIAAVWVLFVAAPIDAMTLRLTGDYGTDPWIVAYLLVFLTCLAYALLDVLRGVLRYAPQAARPLGTGLRVIAVGCLAGLGVCRHEVRLPHRDAVGRPWNREVESGLARSLAVLGGLLVVLGSSLPALESRLGVLGWLRAYRQHRRLYALWAALYDRSLDIALEPPGSRLRDAMRLSRMRFRHYRRVIEILDGLLRAPAKSGCTACRRVTRRS